MREIKFRAKRIDYNEWVEGYLVKFGSVYWIYTGQRDKYSPYQNEYGLDVYPVEKYIIDPETICQYTGLKDKNGVEIWENDIVKNKSKWDENIGVVNFKNARFFVDWKIRNRYSDKGISLRTDDIYFGDEVIGNVFDNKELLEVAE